MYYIDRKVAEEVITAFLERAVFPLMRSGQLKGQHLAVTVVDHSTPRHPKTWSERILFQRFFNLDESTPKYPYIGIAEGKCQLADRTGMSTREVVEFHPELLLEGDVVFPGGIVYGGFAVGVSGLDDWDDEAIAMQIALELWRTAMGLHQNTKASDIDHLPTPSID